MTVSPSRTVPPRMVPVTTVPKPRIEKTRSSGRRNMRGQTAKKSCKEANTTAPSETAPRTVFCNNVLEHVPDPALFAQRCFDLLPPGGRLVVTVPRSYPHHRDPIDTMFRPTPDEICALIDAPYERLDDEIIETGSYRVVVSSGDRRGTTDITFTDDD